MDRLPPMNIGSLGKSRKFRLPYSRTPNFRPAELISKDKKKGELQIGMLFCQWMLNADNSLTGVMLNKDDSNKQADLIIYSEQGNITAQVTRLTFTQFERRKHHYNKKAIEFARDINKQIEVDFPLVVNISPKEKDKVPLADVKSKRRLSIESILLDFIVNCIRANLDKLREAKENIPYYSLPPALKPYFDVVDLCPVPKDHYANVPGDKNVYINYMFYDSTYDASDLDNEIFKIFNAKNNGASDLLIIWANEHELLDVKVIVGKFKERFSQSTFKHVFFMTVHVTVYFHQIK